MRYIGPTIEKIPTTQGAFINQDPLDIIIEGNYTKVPLMMGYTSKEAFFLMSTSGKLSSKDKLYIDFERYVPHFFKLKSGSNLSKEIANKIKYFYFGENEVIAEHIDKYYSVIQSTLFKFHKPCTYICRCKVIVFLWEGSTVV